MGPYAFDRCEVRPEERQLLIDGAPAPLGARAFDLLVALIERHDRVVEKAELFDSVWPGLVVEENNLQVQVSSLRKLLGPNAIATVAGRGYRFVAPLDANATRSEGRAEEPANPSNLPLARMRFIGREAELADCARMLRDARLLTLSGIGGCGKTRLAQELAQRQRPGFPDGVWFVDLGPLQEAQRVSAVLAMTLGVQAERLTDHLKARHALIVMDNCEHVVEAVAKSIGTLLENCGALKIVATSREVLGMSGEQVFAVRSLSLPETEDLDEIRGSEAVGLFVDHARLVVPEFEVNARNAAAIAEICRRLDGIALAIELAAARVRMLSVDDIRARLDDRFRLLTGGNRALPRHQTLQATMQWSHDHLTPAERKLLRRLAVFAGGCTLAAAAQVAGDGADEYDVLECLTALHDKSLLLVDRDTQAQPRYRMLETVRQYAEERLNEAGEGDAVRTAHLAHYVVLAEKAGPDLNGARWSEWFDTFRHEQENVLAAHAWCPNAVEGGELALRLAGSSWRYWSNTAQADRGFGLAEAALALADAEADSPSLCRTLHGRAAHALRLGRYDVVGASAERALRMARRIGDVGLIIDALSDVAIGFLVTGRESEGLAVFTEASILARSASDEARLGNIMGGLGEVHRSRGDVVAAEQAYREALRISRSCHDQRNTGVTLANLSRLLIATDRPAEAKALLGECMSLQASRANKEMVHCSLDVAAALASALGDHPTAARFHGAMERTGHESRTCREPVDEAFFAPRIARSRAALGEAAFDAATAAGWALGYDAATAELGHWLARGDAAGGTLAA